MNAKTAKKLRKQARAMTVGKPDVHYRSDYLNPLMKAPGHATISIRSGCTRYVYKQLKKAA